MALNTHSEIRFHYGFLDFCIEKADGGDTTETQYLIIVSMSRKSDFFKACEPDNSYIFEHTEYEWDDIVNAFIARGLYADSHPQNPWLPLTEKTVGNLSDYVRYLVYRTEYDEYFVLDGTTIKETFNEGKYTHAKMIDGLEMF